MASSRRLSLKEIPQDERPREKLIYRGEHALTDAELIAIVLSSGTKSENALQLAQRILKVTGGLKVLSTMSVQELCDIHGIGPAKAAQLKAALEISRRYAVTLNGSRPKLSNSKQVFEYFHGRFRGKHQEEFWVAALDAKNTLQNDVQVTKGTLMGSLVHPREVFQIAIRNSAAAIVVLHNHPSGDPEPSAEDRKVTVQLAEAGKLMGIPLLDHVIIGNERYYSFKDAGAL